MPAPDRKVTHLQCPVCKERRFALSVHTPYTGVFPSQSCEGEGKIYATCFVCQNTFFIEMLAIAGSYDPGKMMDKGLANAGG